MRRRNLLPASTLQQGVLVRSILRVSFRGVRERTLLKGVMNCLLSEQEFAGRFVESQVVLRGYLMAHIRNFADAEEVFQDVAKVLWERHAEYDPGRPFVRWALGIARNKMLHYHRTRQRARVIFDDELLTSFEARYEELHEELDLRRKVLLICLSEIPAQTRKILNLRYQAGQAISQIAETVGKTANYVHVILSRARDALRKCADKKIAGELDFEGTLP
jgi:RNA polymerase sigma-70 factor (ECF subfamily)